jgi:hypothetical protein
MQHDEIAELAKGLVPFVREVVAEAIDKQPPPPTVPPELVEQIKAAAEVLRQPLPLPATAVTVMPDIAGEIERAIEKVRRVTRVDVTRSGELAVSYSDGTSERLGPVIGPPGEKGAPGERGADGIGSKGEDGRPGRDGVAVTAAAINRGGELMLTLSDGSVLTPGKVIRETKRA